MEIEYGYIHNCGAIKKRSYRCAFLEGNALNQVFLLELIIGLHSKFVKPSLSFFFMQTICHGIALPKTMELE